VDYLAPKIDKIYDFVLLKMRRKKSEAWIGALWVACPQANAPTFAGVLLDRRHTWLVTSHIISPCLVPRWLYEKSVSRSGQSIARQQAVKIEVLAHRHELENAVMNLRGRDPR
jgi:hypothetical protein